MKTFKTTILAIIGLITGGSFGYAIEQGGKSWLFFLTMVLLCLVILFYPELKKMLKNLNKS